MHSNAYRLIVSSLCLSISYAFAGVAPEPVSVKCNTAEYIGFRNSTYNVDTWLGVRYAEPPTGPLRLQPPRPVNNQGVINSTQFGSVCFQNSKGPLYTGVDEDCLFLNIYKPSIGTLHGDVKELHKMPVMLFLHGGGFNDGTGELYGGESLANQSAALEEPMIVVTINYRLSFLGWSGSTQAATLNALNLGLKDQRQALVWIQENIAAFGGDPRKVTVVGQSAGATSLGLHMTVPENFEPQALFRAAIFESGSASSTIPTPLPGFPPYQDAWDAIIAGIGCSNSSRLLECIQAVPTLELFPVISKVASAAPIKAEYPFQPVVDGTYIKEYPSKSIAAGAYAKLPVILGDTTDEVTYAIPTNLNLSSEQELERFVTSNFPFIPTSSIKKLLALDPLSDFPNPSGVGGKEWYRATQIASDLFDRCPGREFVRNISNFAPTYKYRYNAVLPILLATSPELRVGHGAELPYVFGTSYTQYLNTAPDLALSRVTQKAWISFVSHLDPNCVGELGTGAAARWPRYDDQTQQVLVFQIPESQGSPGSGLLVEKDRDDRAACDFLSSIDDQLLH